MQLFKAIRQHRTLLATRSILVTSTIVPLKKWIERPEFDIIIGANFNCDHYFWMLLQTGKVNGMLKVWKKIQTNQKLLKKSSLTCFFTLSADFFMNLNVFLFLVVGTKILHSHGRLVFGVLPLATFSHLSSRLPSDRSLFVSCSLAWRVAKNLFATLF